MGKAFVHPIADGPIVVERGKDMADLLEYVVDSDHVEIGFLLTSKRGIGQVFGCGGGPHRQRYPSAFGADQRLVVATDLPLERLGQGRFHNPAPNLRAALGQRAYIVGIQARKTVRDFFIKPVVGEKHPKGMGRGGEAPWHPYPRIGQLANHLAQRGILTPHRIDIGHAQLGKRHDHTKTQPTRLHTFC